MLYSKPRGVRTNAASMLFLSEGFALLLFSTERNEAGYERLSKVSIYELLNRVN
jgi:hypothetical protein